MTGLPKTALPQDVRRLLETQNLENVSGGELATSYSCSETLPTPSYSSIHGLRPISANRNRLFIIILPKFYAPQPANAEQGVDDIPTASCHGYSEPFFCWEDAGLSRPRGGYQQRAHHWKRAQRRDLRTWEECNHVGSPWEITPRWFEKLPESVPVI